MRDLIRTKWAAVGAAVAVTLGAGGVSLTQAAISSGEKPVYVALVEPCRLVDTRPASNIGPKNTPIASGEASAYEIQVTGANGNCTGALAIPADAVAVAANVTAIAPVAPTTGRSFFTVYPGDSALPTTSNLNFLNGAPPAPNKVDVGLSATGTIRIYNNEGTAHAAVDVFGYYIDHNHDDRYYQKSEVDALLAEKANVSIVAQDQQTGTVALNTGNQTLLSANVNASEPTNLLISAAVEVSSDGGDNDNVNCNIDVDGTNGVRQSMDLADAGFSNSGVLTLTQVFPVAAGAHAVIVECNEGIGSNSSALDRSLSVLGAG